LFSSVALKKMSEVLAEKMSRNTDRHLSEGSGQDTPSLQHTIGRGPLAAINALKDQGEKDKYQPVAPMPRFGAPDSCPFRDFS
jgi:hypothetical protein